jgi:hypothetical protein
MAHLRPIYAIARDILLHWKKPYFGAIPYLQVMSTLSTTQDIILNDRGDLIVRYFLANATTFRGDSARQLKAELKQHLDAHGGA